MNSELRALLFGLFETRLKERIGNHPLLDEFSICALSLIDDLLEPELPTNDDALSIARYKDALNRFRRITDVPTHDRWLDLVAESFELFALHLPEFKPGPFQVDIPITLKAAEMLVANYHLDDNTDFFPALKKTLTRNFAKKNPTAADLLANTPFMRLLKSQNAFNIPLASWREHGFIFAKSGHGKTQTMRTIFTSLLEQDCAIFLLDGLGALIKDLDRIESIQDRLVIFDCAAEDPPNLNLFQLGSDDLYFYLFKAIDQSFTQRQATMISYLMELMGKLPNPTLEALMEICIAPNAAAYESSISTLSPFAQRFFRNEFFAKKVDVLVHQTKAQIRQRLLSLARFPKFDRMLSAPTNDFDAFRLMQEKKIVIINTDARAPKQGGLGEASSIIGRFMLAQILDAARGRPENKRHLALIILDEAKHYLDEQTALILSDARQYGLGMLLATQFPDQLTDGVRKEVINNTSVKMCGPVAYSVVAQVNRDMRCEPDFVMGMKKVDYSHAEWACYIDNLTPSAVKLRVPFGAIEKLSMIEKREVPRVSKPATTERTANVAEPTVTSPALPEQTDTPPSPEDLDGKRWR